jgi:hypothetical protein
MWPGAHGSQVAGRARERLETHRVRRMPVSEKVDSFEKRIAAQDPLGAASGRDNGGIVADPQAQPRAFARRDSPRYCFDQLVFTIHPVPSTSCGASNY